MSDLLRRAGDPLKRYLLLVHRAPGRQTWSDDDRLETIQSYLNSVYFPEGVEFIIYDTVDGRIVGGSQ